jgi:hypothetical protein
MMLLLLFIMPWKEEKLIAPIIQGYAASKCGDHKTGKSTPAASR